MEQSGTKVRRYRLNVWATVALDEDGIPEQGSKDVEKAIFRLLGKMDAECDVEYMDFEDVEEP